MSHTTVRAKFKVDSITTTGYNHRTFIDPENPSLGQKNDVRKFITVELSPVQYDPANNENSAFWSASPSGSLSLEVINPEAAAKFEIAKEYYIDFTLAD